MIKMQAGEVYWGFPCGDCGTFVPSLHDKNKNTSIYRGAATARVTCAICGFEGEYHASTVMSVTFGKQ